MAADAVRRQIEEIKANADRSLAYAALLHLLRDAANDPIPMEILAVHSPPLAPVILEDIHRPDEEIAALALKCLGFMVYHPVMVPTFQQKVAKMVLESIANLIRTTRMKAICNLAVWCISIQQFPSDLVESCMDSVLMAVVHAIENPFGSLSATFEATRAAVRLASQVSGKMREVSDIWVPSIYRRLISTDKKESAMAGRCLLQSKPSIYPPPSVLYEVIKRDLKQTLLPRMMEMLCDHKLKVQAIQAWGWYIQLLGSGALHGRNLLNKMLKIPEQAFTDPDPQVQIAALVAWDGLIDALIENKAVDLGATVAQAGEIQQIGPSPPTALVQNSKEQVDWFLKVIKVVMLPLEGIISSTFNTAVGLSCLDTWCYLLHRLDHRVNHPSVLATAFWPILEVIFSRVPNSQSIYFWTSCLDLLKGFIQSKVKFEVTDDIAVGENVSYLANKKNHTKPIFDSGASRKDRLIRWLPWDTNQLPFVLKMISSIVNQGFRPIVISENRSLAMDAALRIFRSVLQGVRVDLNSPSTCDDSIKLSITAILKFIKELLEDLVSKQIANQCRELLLIVFQFVEALEEDLDFSILVSPLYLVSLDLRYLKDLQFSENIEFSKIKDLKIGSLAYMSNVSPMVYTAILHLSIVVQSIPHGSGVDEISSTMQKLSLLIFSHSPLVNLHAVIWFMYMHIQNHLKGGVLWLVLWSTIAQGLKEAIDRVNDLSFLKTESDYAGHTLTYWFLCYPILMWFSSDKALFPPKSGNCLELCLDSLQIDIEMQNAIKMWNSVFESLNCASNFKCTSIYNFADGLCDLLNRFFDGEISLLESDGNIFWKNSHNKFGIVLLGEVAICLLKHIKVLDLVPVGSNVISQDHSSYNYCSPIKNSLKLVARFLRFALKFVYSNPQDEHAVIGRVFASMASLVNRLCMKQDTILFMEIISDQLADWLSLCAIHGQIEDGTILDQLQCLWAQMLDCLQRRQPPFIFDSSFLNIQAFALQTALDHPRHPISDTAVAFWNATYGKQVNLSFPQCLLPVLDKLLRNGRISLPNESPVLNACDVPSVKEVDRCKRQTMSKMWKNILIDAKKEYGNGTGQVDAVSSGLRRKRLRMGKHIIGSKGAHRRALGNLDGYVSVVHADLSEVMKPSLKEPRKPEYILEMLKRLS